MKKGSKKVIKKQPFAKRQSSAALGLIVGLTVFNLVYSYAIGIPLPRAVVSTYVESVYAVGDAQVRNYEAMGAAVVAAVHNSQEAYLALSSPAAVVVATEESFPPEPLLLVAPNQITAAK